MNHKNGNAKLLKEQKSSYFLTFILKMLDEDDIMVRNFTDNGITGVSLLWVL